MAAAPAATRGVYPLVAICCLGLILLAIAAVIVLALIPVYLKTRGSVSGHINAAGGNTLTKILAAEHLDKTGAIPAIPSNTHHRREIDDESSPLAAKQR